jgi:uncharacterized membrane protein (DUF106 family)
MAWLSTRRVALATLLWTAVVTGSTSAQVVFEVPPDPRQELQHLDAAVLVKQRELFAARQRGDQAAVEKLSKEFNEIQRQRRGVIKKAPQLF